jgi:adenylate kinase
MAPTDELEYLKSLVNQLNEKIKVLESKGGAKPPPPSKEAKGTPKPGGLRMILVGPPGAGALFPYKTL